MSKRRRQPEQLALGPSQSRGWGGVRRGAGRPKRIGGNPHRVRPSLQKRVPLHVTVRFAQAVCNLRGKRPFKAIRQALFGGAMRFETRVVHFSVQGNHIHFLVESADRAALSRAMKGLGVRMARRLNRVMARRGQVIGERYHVRPLRTPTEVRHALHYVRHNHEHHLAQRGLMSIPAGIDPCSSEAVKDELPLPGPETWLLGEGWKRGRGG